MHTVKKKMVLVFVAIVALMPTVVAQKKFQLKGEIGGANGEVIRLTYGQAAKGEMTSDSVTVAEGKFSFEGVIEGSTFGYITVGNRDSRSRNYFMMIMEPTSMKLVLNKEQLDQSILTGSKEHAKYAALELQKKPIIEEMKPLQDRYSEASTAYAEANKALKALEAKADSLKEESAAIREQFSPYQERMGRIDEEFIRQNPGSVVSAYLLRFKVSSMSLEEVEAYYNAFTKDVQNSSFGQDVWNEIQKMRSGSPGSKAFVFAKEDIHGEPLSLADFKGKYVLVDFWASWCVPCRKGNPHLIDLYNKYKADGFEIIGVSDDDRDEVAWKKAVEKDQIGIWKHVLRGLKRVGNTFDRSQDISEHYGVHTLPTKILIDPDGAIIGRYASGAGSDAELDAKLKEVFDK
ncbi:TlpA disulfide reductase family protein [Sphingobacterium gobiense]|uniref:Thioredoxin n=1 Tax=Sphingobacterium gobiense TaxID=1382456 RepID=A0A2S9JGC9_9SPHI|nr:TlpA disulfide reductase family protein [Sphingobacterium gobiense]PRD52006.1 thioredoxin [Sphingobacterium gobiense]